MSLTLDSRLLSVPIDIRQDKKNYIVEDKTKGEFYEMTKVCIDAIHLVNTGKTLGEIEQRLNVKYPKEHVDLIGFAEQLVELELIAEIDGININLAKKKEDLGFMWISPHLGKFFFNKLAYFVYAVLLVFNVSLFITHPSLFPHYKDLFIFDIMVLNIPAWMIISFVMVLIHEFGHILAMRAKDLPTKLEVGHRLFLIVLETDMSLVWKLPPKDRNVLYLAGLCFDTIILSLALLSQLLFENSSGIFLSIMNVIVLDTFIRMVYQFCVYMKTDLYYVFENASGCYNLMENAQQTIRKWFPFLKPNVTDTVLFEEERRTVFFYSLFYFIGVFLTIALFSFFYIPQLLFAWKMILPGFWEEPRTLPFWDAMLFSLQIVLGLLLLLYSWRKKYLKN